MKLSCSIGIMVVALMISGCADSKTNEFEQKLSGVETQINEMQSTVDYQRTKMARYQWKRTDTASIPGHFIKGFQDSTQLQFRSPFEIETCPNGYKLVLSIGNPYYAVFSA